MTEATFDRDGYPTDEALLHLEQLANPAETLDYARELWNRAYGSAGELLKPSENAVVHAKPGERHLRLATGGWSGNESVIGALKANILVWAFTWQLSASGGLHIFKYPKP